jgi:hypothetical protein
MIKYQIAKSVVPIIVIFCGGVTFVSFLAKVFKITGLNFFFEIYGLGQLLVCKIPDHLLTPFVKNNILIATFFTQIGTAYHKIDKYRIPKESPTRQN